jgi:hypothetical protein
MKILKTVLVFTLVISSVAPCFAKESKASKAKKAVAAKRHNRRQKHNEPAAKPNPGKVNKVVRRAQAKLVGTARVAKAKSAKSEKTTGKHKKFVKVCEHAETICPTMHCTPADFKWRRLTPSLKKHLNRYYVRFK